MSNQYNASAWQRFMQGDGVIPTDETLLSMMEQLVNLISSMQAIDTKYFQMTVSSLRGTYDSLSSMARARGIEKYPTEKPYPHRPHLQIGFSPSAEALVRRMRDKTGNTTNTSIVVAAIHMLEWWLKSVEEGSKLQIKTADGEVKDIDLSFNDSSFSVKRTEEGDENVE